MTAIEEVLKPLFNQWLEEAMPKIEARLRREVVLDVGVKAQQTLFNQTEMAKRQGVSVETFRKWRKAGLQAEPNPTGKLLFDLNKVNKWRKDNAAMKEL
uniref:hypothetical protein n=1 Tax=Enterococcus faecalis TaxID=1351 RepID=UPI00359C85BB